LDLIASLADQDWNVDMGSGDDNTGALCLALFNSFHPSSLVNIFPSNCALSGE